MSADSFTFADVPEQDRFRWFVRYGAKTMFDRGFRSMDEASRWIDNSGRRLDWRAGFVARLRGDDKDIEIVDRKGQAATLSKRPRMNVDLLSVAAIGGVIASSIIGAMLKFLLPGYLGEKGGNLATKEDIEHVTDKIEAVKTQYALLVEAAKVDNQLRVAALDARLQRAQQAFTLGASWSVRLTLATALLSF